MNYQYCSISEQGQKRKRNEDSIGIFTTDLGLLIVICDGLGGGLSGEFASKSTVEKIHKSFMNSSEVDLIKRIRSSIESANRFVYEKSNGNLHFKGMATTCEVILLNGTSSVWGHIGDSRIYIFKNNKLKQLTKDHSLIQKLMDDGEIKVKDLQNHPRKNVVVKAIGDNKIPEVDTSKIVIPVGEKFKFFICTDGVTCVVNDAEISEILEGNKIEDSARQLKYLIEERGAPDNYSFVIAAR